jgi:hypothetical protein
LDDPLTFNEQKKPSAYAYTWYLTAITGPDYVDRNTAGPDASDWGYWVKFNYGLWSDHYRWRNPALGYRPDVDSKIRMYSQGKKEVYYLNSISTRTHTALFVKELRFDGKGTSVKGFAPSDTTITNNSPGTTTTNPRNNTTYSHEYPANSLRLKQVILLNNAQVPTGVESLSTTYNQTNSLVQTYYSQDPRGGVTATYQQTIASQFGENVIDINDVNQIGYNILSKSLRAIAFDYDYSLVPGTPNSIDPSGAVTNPGKLTLKSVDFLGTNGTSILPATKFSYEQQIANKQGNIAPVRDNNNIVFTNKVGVFQAVADASNPTANSYEPGDILRVTVGINPDPTADKYYVVLDQINGSSPAQFHVRCLRDVDNISFINGFARATKNPPYQSDHTDWWGMYKSDYNATFTGLAEGIARRTTAVSNKGADVWSLRTITSPTGSKIAINYEGDQYAKPVFDRPDMVCRVSNYPNPDINKRTFIFENLTLAQVKALVIPNNKVLLNGLVSAGKYVNGNYANGYNSAFGVPATIASITAAPSNYGDRAVVELQMTGNQQYSFWNQGAYLSIPKMNTLNEGGGLRVKSVAVTSGNVTHTSSYSYNKAYSVQGSTAYLPSGVTTYEPGSAVRLDKDVIATGDVNSGYPTAAEVLQYKQAYTKSLQDIFAIAREIPAPGVMYEAVMVKEAITRADGTQVEAPNSWTYRFKVFQANMIGHVVTPTSEGPNRLYASIVSIKDYTSRVGSMLSATHYGANGRKLSETVNHFLHDDLDNASYEANSDPGSTGYQARLARFNYQGVIQESFADSRDCLSPDNVTYDHKVVMTKRDVYPTIQTSTTTTDYLTGITTSSETLGFDFYSGTATQTANTDGYGNRFLTEVVPAYRKYPVMGLKLTNAGNRHMLSQLAATTTYKVDASNSALGVVAANVQTWSDQTPVIGLTDGSPEQVGTQAGIWRPWQGYNWLPTTSTADGLTPMTGSNSYTAFNFSTASPSAPWKLTGQTTLYNPYSNALEAKDINGIRLATKLGFNQSKVLISGGPATYQELAYSGAEEAKAPGDYFSGGVAVTWAPGSGSDPGGPWGTGNVDINTNPSYVHTGTASLRVGPYKHGFSYLLNASNSDPSKFYVDPAKSYRASVWVNDPAGALYYWLDNQQQQIVSGTAQKRTADGWYLLEIIIPPIGTGHSSLRIGCYNNNPSASAYFDDLRFEPLNAQATSYVYNQLTGQVTDILDNNNLYTHYDYTSDGKLRRVTHESFQYGGKKLVEYSFHLTGMLDAATLTVDASGLATVTVPEAAGPLTITYDPGDNAGYRTLSASASPYTFSALPSGNRWVKVRLQDGQGNVRELIKHLN